MLPSFEDLLRGIGGPLARGLVAVDRLGGQNRALRNAAQATAIARAQRREREQALAWLDERAALHRADRLDPPR